MAKLITKFLYLKPSRKRKAGGYATYIATREGVEILPQEKTYADYIATRPRSQGLFTDAGKEINLRQLSKELNQYQGNLWTVILSLGGCRTPRLRHRHPLAGFPPFGALGDCGAVPHSTGKSPVVCGIP